MPELPEVEVTKRVLETQILGNSIDRCEVFEPKLRWPIALEYAENITNAKIIAITRVGKYLLFETTAGYWMAHLGMSGHFSIYGDGADLLDKISQCNSNQQRKHRHVAWLMRDGKLMLYTDPRRFGCIIWLGNNRGHKLLDNLGIEPLVSAFTGKWLYQTSKLRKTNIKSVLMNANLVVGIGNIYANEGLHNAKIDPRVKACDLTLKRCNILVRAVKDILQQAIETGGSTISDFTSPANKTGYFQTHFKVYGKTGQTCSTCSRTQIVSIVQQQRSTFFCPECQRK